MQPMDRLLNTRETIVTEAIDALLSSSSGKHLARLDGFPHIKVVVRKDWDRNKVAVVSGGGAGHEPAHAGFVGQGRLAGAVAGGSFAPPSGEGLLACIPTGPGEPGRLFIWEDSTRHRVN